MKNKRLIYFALQLKRNSMMLPRVIALTLALTVLCGAVGYLFYKGVVNDDSKRLVTVAIVGTEGSKVLGATVEVINKFDAARYAVKVERMTEDEARASLLRGEISGYIVVPKNYVRDMYNGKDIHLSYVSSSGVSSIASLLLGEIIGISAKVSVESSNAIYGVQDYVHDKLKNLDPSETGDRLLEKYEALMLTRRDLYSVETIGVSGHGTMLAYIICGLMITFLLLWGVSAAPLFVKNGEMRCMLASRGFGAAKQIAGESAAYAALMTVCTAPLFIAVRAATAFLNIEPESFGSASFLAAYFLCMLEICAMQFFLYEITRDSVSAPLLQFLNAVAQGYISGCFYPQSFFPAPVRAVASHLPVGVCVRLLGDRSLPCAAECAAYAAVFFGAAIFIRHRAITRWETQS